MFDPAHIEGGGGFEAGLLLWRYERADARLTEPQRAAKTDPLHWAGASPASPRRAARVGSASLSASWCRDSPPIVVRESPRSRRLNLSYLSWTARAGCRRPDPGPGLLQPPWAAADLLRASLLPIREALVAMRSRPVVVVSLSGSIGTFGAKENRVEDKTTGIVFVCSAGLLVYLRCGGESIKTGCHHCLPFVYHTSARKCRYLPFPDLHRARGIMPQEQ